MRNKVTTTVNIEHLRVEDKLGRIRIRHNTATKRKALVMKVAISGMREMRVVGAGGLVRGELAETTATKASMV